MADQRIVYTENMVGADHPTLSDTLNRLTLVEHENDGTHKTTLVATLTATQTLTNKTIALGSNTVSGTLAQFNTAVTDATLVSLTGTETLTNKTLTSPKINEDVALTATATELNVLDGITATTTELNYVDGVTSAIQTQLNDKQEASTAITTSNIGSQSVASATTADTCTGNAATATALATARTIGGVSFDGTANIDLPGVNAAGTQNTTGSAAGLSDTTGFPVGSIAFLKNMSIENVLPDGTITGGNLVASDNLGTTSAYVQTGTWRCLGWGYHDRATLWRRIA